MGDRLHKMRNRSRIGKVDTVDVVDTVDTVDIVDTVDRHLFPVRSAAPSTPVSRLCCGLVDRSVT